MTETNTSSCPPVSRQQRESLLAQLQPELTASRFRRRRLDTVRGIGIATLLAAGLLAWLINPADSKSPNVGTAEATPTLPEPTPPTTIFVGNRPQLARDVVVCNSQVDTTTMGFTNVSDDELLAMLDHSSQPISVARIDDRLVVIAVREMGENDILPVRAVRGPALN